MENYTPRAVRPAMATEQKETVNETPSTPVSRSFTTASQKTQKPPKRLKWILGAVIALALICGVGWFFMRGVMFGNSVDSGKYQAVFLTSGQVYFGKLQFVNNEYMKLSDVFYIQTSTTSTDSKNPQTATDNSNMQLIKLGNEVHGPDDAMIISRGQVLFYENLKSDGKVTQSIQKYKTENK